MGLLSSYIKNFNEAEVDGQQLDDGQDPGTDYTADASSNQPPETSPAPTDQPQGYQNDQGPQGPPPDDQTTDYTQMDGDDEGYDDRQGYPDDGGGQPQHQEEEQPVDDLKAKEEELYANLTPEQLDIKHRELKTQFLEMFDLTSTIIERIGNTSIDEENIASMEFISSNLIKFRDMLSDYVNDVYQTKSYTENSINYNRFLAVLNGINKMLEEMHKKESN